MGRSAVKPRNVSKFICRITLGDLIQISVMIISIGIGVWFATNEMKGSLRQQTESIGARIDRLFVEDPNETKLEEGAVYVFKRDPSSSFTITSIDPEESEVAMQTNIIGTLRNETLPMGRTTTIRIPDGGTYTLILTGIDVIQGNRIAKFVISEEKGVKQ